MSAHAPFTVLVASDGSDVSAPALQLARLLGARGASVEVAAVIEPLVFPGPEAPIAWAGVDTERRDALSAVVSAQAAELLGDVRPAHVDTIIGLPVPELAGVARDRHAAMIVTGVRQHGLFDRVFLRGETPLHIARDAHRPVLVVSAPVNHLPRVVVVATDLDDASVNAARIAAPLLAEARTVHLVHVRSMPAIPGGAAATAWTRFYDQMALDHFERLRAVLELSPEADVDSRTLSGHPVEEILSFVDAAGAELLVTGFRRLPLAARIAGSRSTAERLYRGTSVPMLLVPESAVDARAADHDPVEAGAAQLPGLRTRW